MVPPPTTTMDAASTSVKQGSVTTARKSVIGRNPTHGSSVFRLISHPLRGHLHLPTIYARMYWRYIPNDITLQTRDGRFSGVKMFHSHGKFCIRKEEERSFFNVVMEKIFIQGPYIMNFEREIGVLNKMNGCAVELRLVTNNLWFVECEINDMYACFKQGWRKFVEDCGLLIGDVLMFEKEDSNPNTWYVTIHRVLEVSGSADASVCPTGAGTLKDIS